MTGNEPLERNWKKSDLPQEANDLPEGYIFNKGINEHICGSNLGKYLNFYRTQSEENAFPEFKHIPVIHFTKDQQLKKIGTLGSIEKDIRRSSSHMPTTKKFIEHIKMNNAIFCPNTIQHINREGKLKTIGAIIYGTQETDHCNEIESLLQSNK